MGGWWYYGWELSWIATTAIGARQIEAKKVSAWADPLYDAFTLGAWFLYWTDDTLYWIAKPSLKIEIVGGARRLHCENGAAVISDVEDLYFWHGVLVPTEWIADKASLSPETALTWRNVEQRRAACEIIGWDRILAELNAKVIDRDRDPMIGELVEVNLPDSGKERFLRVLCGTGRKFAIPVPRNMKTALESQAWCYGVDTQVIRALEVRT